MNAIVASILIFGVIGLAVALLVAIDASFAKEGELNG